MLSYLHEFHAGNHADILKHCTLLYVLEYLNKKNKPYSFFDTHSGAGLYNLKNEEALKTGEAERGIGKLLKIFSENQSSVPQELNPYLNFVSSCQKKSIYPGSPVIQNFFALNESSLFFTELHKGEFEKLEKNLNSVQKIPGYEKKNCTISLSNTSGWDMLKSKVPPVLKRGGILCDPSYEEKSDYINAGELLSLVHKKWSGATILLWYPLLANKAEEIDSMKQMILSTVKKRDVHTEVLDAQLCIDTEDSHVETSLQESIGSSKPRLYGSGMLVVNPSWGLDEHLKKILPYLSKTLGNDDHGSCKIEFLCC